MLAQCVFGQLQDVIDKYWKASDTDTYIPSDICMSALTNAQKGMYCSIIKKTAKLSMCKSDSHLAEFVIENLIYFLYHRNFYFTSYNLR